MIVHSRARLEVDGKEQLSRIESLDIASRKFLDELTRLRDERMAKAVQAAEAIAPTRPHPNVESAKLNFALGPFASLLDRARDVLSRALGS